MVVSALVAQFFRRRYLGLVMGVSVLIYRSIEEPANRWLRTRFHRALEA